MKKIILGVGAVSSAIISGWMFKRERYGPETTLLWLSAIGMWMTAIWPKRQRKIKMPKRTSVFVFLIFWIIIGLVWIYRLDIFPSGIWTDEIEISVAGKNLWKEMIKKKCFLSFTPEATGHPGLTSILTAWGLKTWGDNQWGLRMPSVVFGWLAIIPLYLLVRKKMGEKTATIVSAMYGLSYWQLSLVRIAYEAGYFWFFFNWCLWILFSFHRDKKSYSLVWLGICCGLGLYTYQAFRIIFFGFVALVAISLFCFQREKRLKGIFQLSLLVLSFGMVISPFFFYWRHYPETVFGRANDVSVFNKKFNNVDRFGMIKENTFKALGMFFWEKDPNLRHNIGQRPVLNLVEGLLLVAGVVILTKKRHYFWLSTIIILGLISAASGIFTYEPPYIIQPHSLRTLGLLPLVYIVIAFALEKMLIKIDFRLVVLLCFFSGVVNLKSYFGTKITKGIYESFQTGQTVAAKILSKNCSLNTAVSRSLINDPHINFLAPGCNYKIYSKGQNAELFLLNESDFEEIVDKQKAVKISF